MTTVNKKGKLPKAIAVIMNVSRITGLNEVVNILHNAYIGFGLLIFAS